MKFKSILFFLITVIISVMGTVFYINYRYPGVLRVDASVNKEEVKNIMKEYLEGSPDVIMQLMKDTEVKFSQKQIEAMKNELENDLDDPRVVSPNAKIKVITFSDYSSPSCRKIGAVEEKLVPESDKVEFIFKELPILSPASVIASKAALAVNMLDKSKYFKFRTALLTEVDINDQSKIFALAAKQGINVDALKEAMANPKIEQIIEKNKKLANDLNIRSIPAYIIDGQYYSGNLSYDSLKEKLASLVASVKKMGSEAEKMLIPSSENKTQ